MKKVCPLPLVLAAWQEEGHVDGILGLGVLVPWSYSSFLRGLHVLVIRCVGRGRHNGSLW